MSDEAAFYVEERGVFVPTELTRGPWDRRYQHGGPVAALLGREMQRTIGDDSMRLARLSVELARPAPILPCSVFARLLHSGRRVATAAAELHEGGRLVARASAVFVRERAIEVPPAEVNDVLEPTPEACEPLHLPFFVEPAGYHTAMELRAAGGRFGSGRLSCWMRMKVALVSGEEPSPAARVLVAADSGSGVSMRLDPARYLFTNADLVVALHRLPRGEWVGMEAATLVEEGGVGLADTCLFDARGRIGRGTQMLVVEPRA